MSISGRTGDISSQDSNIITYFQSFDKNNFTLNADKELSQVFAKIEVIIKDELDLSDNNIVSRLNDVYNLMILSIAIVEKYPKLLEYFKEYFDVKLNNLLLKIFVGSTFDIFYNLTNDNIDIIWQIQRLVKLCFEFEFSNNLSIIGDYKFSIASETTIIIIKFLQLTLFKYSRSDTDEFIYNSIDSHNARPCEFFRGKIIKGFIINQKIELLDDLLTIILINCELTSKLLQFFHNTLTNRPTYFSYEIYNRNFSIILQKIENMPQTTDVSILEISRKINEIINHAIIGTLSKLPSDKFMILHDSKSETVQIHGNSPKYSSPDQHQPKFPKWINYFELQDQTTQQNSDYDNIPTPQSTISVTAPGLMELKTRKGFRQRFKHIFWNTNIKVKS